MRNRFGRRCMINHMETTRAGRPAGGEVAVAADWTAQLTLRLTAN